MSGRWQDLHGGGGIANHGVISQIILSPPVFILSYVFPSQLFLIVVLVATFGLYNLTARNDDIDKTRVRAEMYDPNKFINPSKTVREYIVHLYVASIEIVPYCGKSKRGVLSRV